MARITFAPSLHRPDMYTERSGGSGSGGGSGCGGVRAGRSRHRPVPGAGIASCGYMYSWSLEIGEEQRIRRARNRVELMLRLLRAGLRQSVLRVEHGSLFANSTDAVTDWTMTTMHSGGQEEICCLCASHATYRHLQHAAMLRHSLCESPANQRLILRRLATTNARIQ